MVRFRRQFVLKLTLYFIQTDSVLNRWRRPQRGNTRDPIPNKSELKQIYEQSRRRWASASGRSSCPECRIAKLLQLVRKIPFTSLSNPSHPVCTQQISSRFQNKNLPSSRTGPTPSRRRGGIMRMRVIRKQSLLKAHTWACRVGRLSVGVKRPVCARLC